MVYNSYISINPEVRFGRPCITGTRISVADVLGWLGNSQTIAEILEDFPELTQQQIQACLFYAADRERHLRLPDEAALRQSLKATKPPILGYVDI
ncbi:DUF433 domain-containing protein [uncultured Hymenobacter sp.]|uniref:DUF433 domain-containing protein n=1 Tax=uncultured Hymenobacter sp. TaxID=170016 RepID=UPI0035CA0E4C